MSESEARQEMLALQDELKVLKQQCQADRREPMDDEIQVVEAHLSRLKWLRMYIERAKGFEEVTGATEPSNHTVPEVYAGSWLDHGGERNMPTYEQRIKLGTLFQRIAQAGGYQGLVEERATGLGELVPSEGGFLVGTDMADVLDRVYDAPVSSRCWKIPISSGANSVKIPAIDETSRADGSRGGGLRGYWTAEAGEVTASALKFREIELVLKKVCCLQYASDELLQDAAALQAVISKRFTEELSLLLDDALINGSGSGQPQGIMNSAALVTVTRDTASEVNHADIVAMWARLWARSRPTAVWFINQGIEAKLHSMTIASGVGSNLACYMPPGGLSQAPYGTLMGRPVIPIEQCATLGTTGDIILADMSQYALATKGGMSIDSSMHVRFVYHESCFRGTLRCDGASTWNNTLTPFKGSNTQSPFVVLDAGS